MRIHLRHLLLLLVLPIACTKETDAPIDPGFRDGVGLRPTADARVDPSGTADFLLDFGSVVLGSGEAAEASIMFFNGTAADVTLRTEVEGGAFAVATDESLELAVDGVASIRFRFAPAVAGDAEAIATVLGGERFWTIRLIGHALPEPGGDCLLSIPETIDFGVVRVGGSSIRSALVENFGDGPCRIPAPALSSGDFEWIHPRSIELAPGRSTEIVLAYRPIAPGGTSKPIQLGERSLRLEGTARTHCITGPGVRPSFAPLPPACTFTEEVIHLQNHCTEGASFTGATVEGSSFMLKSRPASGPIAAGPFELVIAFRPEELGTHAGSVLVEFAGEELAVDWEATSTPVIFTDEFHQPRQQRIDLLVVLDDGAEMQPYQAEIGELAERLGRSHKQGDSAVRWAMTTTSRSATDGCAGSGADGRLMPFDGSGPRWLNADHAPPGAFAELLEINPCSTAPNQGFATAWRALSEIARVMDDPAHPEAGDGNAGFFRFDAYQSILFISARDDESGEDVATWRNRFLSLDGLISIHAIVPLADACVDLPPGIRFQELADDVNDFCSEATWEPRYGSGGTTDRSRFSLSHAPVDLDGNLACENAIEVRIDGILLEAVGPDESIRWTCQEQGGTFEIVFETDFIPDENTTIETTYPSIDCW